MKTAHALRALKAVADRELHSFARQVAGCAVAFFALALWGYDPQRGTPVRNGVGSDPARRRGA